MNRFHAVVFILIATLVGFGLTACQRNNENVQAARERSATPETPATEEANPAGEPTPTGTNAISDAEKHFLMTAEKDSIQEVDMGRLAQQKSQNSDVKSYGKMLVKDHEDALGKIADLMKKNGIEQSKSLPHAKNEAVNKMQGLSGAAFDREFVNLMIMDHQKAVETFRSEANTAQNSDVRDFAKDMLPTLEKHLKEAQDLQNKIGTKRTE